MRNINPGILSGNRRRSCDQIRSVTRNLLRRYDLFAICALFLSIGWSYAATNRAPRLPHGFAYHHDEIASVPWSVHIVKVDRANRDLELHSALAQNGRFGAAALSEQVKALPAGLGRPVAAINGDYYRDEGAYTGDPKGLQIVRGELVSGPCDWTCFWVDANGDPQMTNVTPRFEVTWPAGEKTPIGLNEERTRTTAVLYSAVVGATSHTSGGRDLVLERNGTNSWLPLRAGQLYSARVKEIREEGNAAVTSDTLVLSVGRQLNPRAPDVQPGAIVQISTATSPALQGVTTAIGGGPALVRNGTLVPHNEINVRNPRSAIGWSRDYFFFVQVDGRQRKLSVGMTTRELSDYMIKLGCESAMSLDGGGSATCWVYGQVMNSPSEGFERPMANSLVLVQKEKK